MVNKIYGARMKEWEKTRSFKYIIIPFILAQLRNLPSGLSHFHEFRIKICTIRSYLSKYWLVVVRIFVCIVFSLTSYFLNFQVRFFEFSVWDFAICRFKRFLNSFNIRARLYVFVMVKKILAKFKIEKKTLKKTREFDWISPFIRSDNRKPD